MVLYSSLNWPPKKLTHVKRTSASTWKEMSLLINGNITAIAFIYYCFFILYLTGSSHLSFMQSCSAKKLRIIQVKWRLNNIRKQWTLKRSFLAHPVLFRRRRTPKLTGIREGRTDHEQTIKQTTSKQGASRGSPLMEDARTVATRSSAASWWLLPGPLAQYSH